MPQINLLDTEAKQRQLPWEKLLSLFSRLLILVLIALLGWYAYAVMQSKKVASDIYTMQNKIIQTQAELANNKDRRELLTRQGQLQAVQTVLKNHAYWSKLLPELARVTVKSASYLAFSSQTDGTARIIVTVPTYADFDKFLQVFDLPQFNENFSDVKVVSVSNYQIGSVAGTKFEVLVQYNRDYLLEQPVPPPAPAPDQSAVGQPVTQ